MLEMFLLAVVFSLLCELRFSMTCDMKNSSKMDCGYAGIDSAKCEQKGCCWSPDSSENIPWCYYPNWNCFVMTNDTQTAPFSDSEIDEMYGYWAKNFDIDGLGGCAAAPSYTTSCSAGSYYYHWQRDCGLSYRSRMMLLTFEEYEKELKDYVQFVLKVQNEADPNKIDVRIEPKFKLPNGEVYTEGWCRPQSDGPAIRSTTLMLFAQNLIEKGEMDYVKKYLWTGSESQYNGGAIKYDLEWVSHNWDQDSCNLWEDFRSTDFFWNRMHFALALKTGSEFSIQMGDKGSGSYYQQQYSSVNSTIYSGHWNGKYLFEVSGRPRDAAVVIALNHYTDIFGFNSYEVASTVGDYIEFFCSAYPINQKDTNNGIPGVMYGRYETDVYCGGNPWILTTVGLAELFYRASIQTLKEGLPEQKSVDVWKQIFSSSSSSSNSITKEQLAELFFRGGDSVLKRIVYHTKGAKFHLAEQLDKDSGYEESAQDLTWSFTNTLRANYFRKLAFEMVNNK